MAIDRARRRFRSWHVVLGLSLLAIIPPAWTLIASDQALEERRQRVAQMTSAEKQALQQKMERFERLSDAQQEELRALHQRIAQASNNEQLQAVMARYGEWLKTLSALERAELLRLPKDERLDRIRQLKRRFEEQRFGQTTQLDPEDAKHIFSWLDEFAQTHEEELRQKLPDRQRRWFDRTTDTRSRRATRHHRIMLLGAVFRHHGQEAMPQPTAGEIEALLAPLSEAARQEYQSQPDDAARQALVGQWIRAALLSRIRLPEVSQDELERFFAEELTPREREWLERLPRDRLYRELERIYHRRRDHVGPMGRPHSRHERRGNEEREFDRGPGDRPPRFRHDAHDEDRRRGYRHRDRDGRRDRKDGPEHARDRDGGR